MAPSSVFIDGYSTVDEPQSVEFKRPAKSPVPNGLTNGHRSNGVTNDDVNGAVHAHVNGETSHGVAPKQDLTAGTSASSPEPLAIVGMSCRLPGDVKTPQEFWELCARKRSGWSSIPNSRFNAESFYHPDAARTGTFNSTGGNFLSQDPGVFDAPFFNVSLQEARALDPQQRILLECAYEALEYGGIAREAIGGEDVGVFIGGSLADYELRNLRDVQNVPMYQTTGNAQNMLSNRISYFFNLRGPSFTIDTACSSSMVALHLACQSLRNGESSSAIVGGCHLNLLPDNWVSMSLNRLFADSGRCYPFDHRGQSGYGRGEGAGVLVLKPLSSALENGDTIKALIMNSGINQDGATQGISVPNQVAQEQLMRQVYSSAALDPKLTGYVETHGTGTKVGDPIEATALHTIFGEGRTKRQPLYIGSVKSNLGHSEGASGIVSVIKSAMMLDRGFILPNCDFEKGKDNIPLDKWGMKVPVKQVPWPTGKKYISVNSFGYGGSNAHVVLAKAPPANTELITSSYHLSEGIQHERSLHRLFVLSANDEQSAREMMKNLQIFCEQNPEVYDLSLMDNLAYTLCQRRSMLPWKVAITARSIFELVAKLSAAETKPVRTFETPSVGFVFTGQGAQWHAMGRQLIGSYPAFARTLMKASDHVIGLGAKFSLVEELMRGEKESLVSEAHISQPACTAVQLALVDLFASWGVSPIAVVGHSSGEIGAAYAAGCLTLEDCMSVAFWRGVFSSQLERANSGVKGAMMAVGASEEDMRPYLRKLTAGKADVACVNSDSSLTISGDDFAVQELEGLLKEQSIFCRRLKVGVAYHSYHMRQIAEAYHNKIARVVARDSTVSFHSSVYGRRVKPSELGSNYWVDNLISPVQFSKGLRDLLAGAKSGSGQRVNTLLEIGPHPALEGPIKQTLKADDKISTTSYVGSLRRGMDAVEAMQQAGVALHGHGQKLDFNQINFPVVSKKPTVITNLPKYPWNHSRSYWHESRLVNNHMHPRFPRSDLLGLMGTESDDLEPRWRNIIRADDLPWIREHRVQGNNVYPLAGYLAMAIEASSQLAKMHGSTATGFSLREITAAKALIVPESSPVETMLSLRPYAEGTRVSSDSWNEFRVFAWIDNRWDEYCRGMISIQTSRKSNPLTHLEDVQASTEAATRNQLDSSSKSSIDAESIYSAIEEKGFCYHNLFRGVRNCRLGPDGTIFDFTVPETIKHMPFEHETDYILHPVTLDIIIQAVWPLLGAGSGALRSLYLPSFLKSLKISSAQRIPVGKELRVYGTQGVVESKGAPINHSMLVVDSEDPRNVFVHAEGLVMTPLADASDDYESDSIRRLCYKTEYLPCFDLMDAYDLKSGIAGNAGVSATKDQLATCLRNMTSLNPNMSVLGISADEGETFLQTLECLGAGTARFNKFVFANQSMDEMKEEMKEKFAAWNRFMAYQKLDVSADPIEQGLEEHSYDVVIAHAVSDTDQSLGNIHRLLKSGGKLLVLESASRHASPIKSKSAWTSLLRESGFSGLDFHYVDDIDAVDSPCRLAISTAQSPRLAEAKDEGVILIRPDEGSGEACNALAKSLTAQTGTQVEVATLSSANAKGKVCVVLYELDEPRLSKLTSSAFEAMQRLLTTAAGVLWVARNATASITPDGNLVTGLARSVRSEADLRFAVLDLEDGGNAVSQSTTKDISRVYKHVFGQNRSVLTESDMEFVSRNGTIMVPRIVEDQSTNDLVRQAPSNGTVLLEQPFKQPNRRLTMALGQPGLLDTVYFTDDAAAAQPLPDKFIEIEVQYVGLNFKDVMHAMGQLHSDDYGLECSGIVKQCGSGVDDFTAGDRVCAIAPGCVANVARCRASSAWKIPENVESEAAATVPIVFCTAYYSLVEVARVQPGESVLIHAAAGGVGQAAIMIAQALGADIFATVGSMEKKSHLMTAFGIPEQKIFFSRDTSFAPAICKATNGTGVDVVLNSLAGDSLRATWECIAPLGRFVEIGKRDIKRNSRLEMGRFDDGVMFASVDLMVIAEKRPTVMKRILRDVFDMLSRGDAQPVSPRTCYSVADVPAALSSLQTGRAMGKVALKLHDDAIVKVNRPQMLGETLKADASYIIVGGTGGIGRSMAYWMAQHGARHIVLVSRSGGDPSMVAQLSTTLREKFGAQVMVCNCDMADASSVESNLGGVLKSLPPVGGAVYSAMVLRDALFENMTFEDYNVVMKAKVDGVWNLHNVLLSQKPDFFITISSLAGIVGNRGQAAYAATSTFMNAFVSYRHSLSLPCATLDLAPVTGIGYLAENSDREKVVSEAFGQGAVTEEEIHNLLAAAIAGDLTTNCGGHCITGLEITNHNKESFWINDPKFSLLLKDYHDQHASDASQSASGAAVQSLAERIRAASDLEAAKEVVIQALIGKVAAILLLSEEDIHRTSSPANYGLDSLVSIEFRNWIAKELGAGLQILEILGVESLADLADLILERSKLLVDEGGKKRKFDGGDAADGAKRSKKE